MDPDFLSEPTTEVVKNLGLILIGLCQYLLLCWQQRMGAVSALYYASGRSSGGIRALFPALFDAQNSPKAMLSFLTDVSLGCALGLGESLRRGGAEVILLVGEKRFPVVENSNRLVSGVTASVEQSCLLVVCADPIAMRSRWVSIEFVTALRSADTVVLAHPPEIPMDRTTLPFLVSATRYLGSAAILSVDLSKSSPREWESVGSTLAHTLSPLARWHRDVRIVLWVGGVGVLLLACASIWGGASPVLHPALATGLLLLVVLVASQRGPEVLDARFASANVVMNKAPIDARRLLSALVSCLLVCFLHDLPESLQGSPLLIIVSIAPLFLTFLMTLVLDVVRLAGVRRGKWTPT